MKIDSNQNSSEVWISTVIKYHQRAHNNLRSQYANELIDPTTFKCILNQNVPYLHGLNSIRIN